MLHHQAGKEVQQLHQAEKGVQLQEKRGTATRKKGKKKLREKKVQHYHHGRKKRLQEKEVQNQKVQQREKKKSYSTQYSHLVSYDSTDWAITWLSSQIGRDTERSGVYGRSCLVVVGSRICSSLKCVVVVAYCVKAQQVF